MPDSKNDLSNVVPFRPIAGGESHPFEFVELFPWNGNFWVALAGPWVETSDGAYRGHKPWRRVATFPLGEPDKAADYARELAADYGIPMVNLAKAAHRLVDNSGDSPDPGPMAA